MSNIDGNFVLEKFKEFHKKLNLEQAVSSSYHHQSNGHVEANIMFKKQKLKKCFKTNNDTYLA